MKRLTKMGENSPDYEMMDLSKNQLINKKNVLEKAHDQKCENFVRFTKSNLAMNVKK